MCVRTRNQSELAGFYQLGLSKKVFDWMLQVNRWITRPFASGGRNMNI